MRGRDTGMEEERGTETATVRNSNRQRGRETNRQRQKDKEIDFLCPRTCSGPSLF